MAKKDFLLAMGERSVNPGDTDELLRSKISERKRKEIARQEELDEAEHKTKMAKLKKDETSAEAAVEKSGEKKEETGGFKTTGEVKMGVIDLQAERQQAIQDLKDLKKDQEETLKTVGQENQQLREKIHEQEMKVISTSFEAALASVKEKLESKGTVAEQIAGIRAMAKELGMAQPEPGVGDPALQLQMLELKHAEAAREREFQWQMQKHQEDLEEQREKRKDEKAIRLGELAREEKRDDMVAKAPQYIGGAIAQGLLANQGKGRGVAEEAATETKAPRGKQGKHVEAGWGESGEVECPGCNQPIAIGPTARTAVCANCGERVPIRRTGERPTAEEE